MLARGESADAIFAAEIFGTVLRADLDGFERSEAGFDQQFNFVLIAEAWKNAAVAGGVGAGEQQASRFGESEFEIHFFAQQSLRGRGHGNSCARGEVALRRFRRHGVERALLQFGAARRAGFEHGKR